MVSLGDSAVTIQTSAQPVPSTPSWFGEVTVIASYLERLGVLKDYDLLDLPYVQARLTQPPEEQDAISIVV